MLFNKTVSILNSVLRYWPFVLELFHPLLYYCKLPHIRKLKNNLLSYHLSSSPPHPSVPSLLVLNPLPLMPQPLYPTTFSPPWFTTLLCSWLLLSLITFSPVFTNMFMLFSCCFIFFICCFASKKRKKKEERKKMFLCP